MITIRDLLEAVLLVTMIIALPFIILISIDKEK